MTQGVHPFPYRTRKLSPVVPKIVGWRRPVKEDANIKFSFVIVLAVKKEKIFLHSSVGRAHDC